MAKLVSTKKIGLMGTFGYGNLGDAAIQDAMIQNIRKYFPDAEIYGYSLNPEDTLSRHGIQSFPISRMSWKEDGQDGKRRSITGRIAEKLRNSPKPAMRRLERWVSRVPIEFGLAIDAYKNLKDIDLLIVSGGGQLDDYWAGGGPWSHPYTMLKWGILSKLRKAKYMFVSVGAGPIDARLSQIFIRYALSLADYRSYRDRFSKELIEHIGFRSDDPVYPDLAHSYQIKNGRLPENPDKSRPVVGIGPIGYFKSGCWPEQNEAVYSSYLEKMAAFVTWLVGKGYAIIFLPGEVHYDQIAINDLKALLREQNITPEGGQILERPICTVDDLIEQIALADAVVVSRFHNVLLAQLTNKPVVALSYQAKIDALMADTGQGNLCFPVGQFEVQQLQEGFLTLETHQDSIKKQVAQRVHEYRAALDEQYGRIFKSIS